MTNENYMNKPWYQNPDLLKAAHREYGTLEAAASALGSHKSTLAYWWKRHGFEKLPRGPKTSVNEEALRKLHKSVYG